VEHPELRENYRTIQKKESMTISVKLFGIGYLNFEVPELRN
jgi:hypothetical protein